MERSYYVVDAFTDKAFTGNAAGVVLDAEGLTDARMAAIASEFNLSETTFVLPPTTAEADVRFRWFTPTVEVDMCGHATIAGVHALREAGRDARPTLRVETRSGVLPIEVEEAAGLPGSPGGDARPTLPGGDARPPTPGGDARPTVPTIWMGMPEPTVSPISILREDLTEGLNIPADLLVKEHPPVRTRDEDLIVLVRDVLTLNDIRPNFAAIAKASKRMRLRGWCVATTSTLTPSITVQSRFFAPAAGVDEDPVTGSVHGPLAAYLVARGLVPMHEGVAGLTCVQAKAGGRAGLLRVLVERLDPKRTGQEADPTSMTGREAGPTPAGPTPAGYAVKVGGQAVTTMRGVLVAE